MGHFVFALYIIGIILMTRMVWLVLKSIVYIPLTYSVDFFFLYWSYSAVSTVCPGSFLLSASEKLSVSSVYCFLLSFLAMWLF